MRMPTSDESLEILMAGNQRYVTGKMSYPHQTTDYRQQLSQGQSPFALILGCADSRVPPNIVFDQGLGDLFVIRVAGNIIDDAILGSIEFAAGQLRTPLVVVLGHSKCGAIEATVAGGRLPGHLPVLAQSIQPAVDSVKDSPGDLLDNAIRANARFKADELRASEPILAGLVQAKKLKIVAGYYDLDTGKVEILD